MYSLFGSPESCLSHKLVTRFSRLCVTPRVLSLWYNELEMSIRLFELRVTRDMGNIDCLYTILEGYFLLITRLIFVGH